MRLYADEVILLADSLRELFLALRICSKWANENSMEWSSDAAQSQILLSAARRRNFYWLPFATGRIQTTTKAKYLGVQVTARGIVHGLNVKKYRAANLIITQLCRARIIVTGMTPQLGRLLHVTLIQSKLYYASILTPVDGVGRSERVRLDMIFFKTILGISVQTHHVVKLREMLRIEATYWRRRRLCQAISRRLLGMAERGVLTYEEAGQFGVEVRKTLDARKAIVDSFPIWNPLENHSFRNKKRRYKWDSRKRCSRNGRNCYHFSRNASRMFTLGELETEENSAKVASWECPTVLLLLMKDWVVSIDDRTQI